MIKDIEQEIEECKKYLKHLREKLVRSYEIKRGVRIGQQVEYIGHLDTFMGEIIGLTKCYIIIKSEKGLWKIIESNWGRIRPMEGQNENQ